MNEEYSPESGMSPDDKETNTWAMILHLSMLSGLVVPLAGLIVPIVIYVLKKDSLPGLKPHGYVVFNWMISAIIYAIISVILLIVVIGGFMLAALALVSLIFPIIGGVKASEGEVWPYPLSIKFFK
jgi:hypothetical protein